MRKGKSARQRSCTAADRRRWTPLEATARPRVHARVLANRSEPIAVDVPRLLASADTRAAVRERLQQAAAAFERSLAAAPMRLPALLQRRRIQRVRPFHLLVLALLLIAFCFQQRH